MRLKLTTKFIMLTSSALVVTMVLFALFNISSLQNAFLEASLKDLDNLSETIIRTTHYQMLEDDRERVYQMMEEVGEQKGIERIRIFNKKGIISFSTEKAEKGSLVPMDEEGCVGCHSGDTPLVRAPTESRSRIFRNGTGSEVLGLTKEIRNQKSCYTAECHFHPQNVSCLGILDVHVSLAGMNSTVNAYRNEILVFTFVLLAVLSACLATMTRRFVNIPITKMVEHTRKLARGDWTTRMGYIPRDELGDLANSFNDMTQELKNAHDQLEEWGERSQESLRRVTRALETRSRCNRTMIQATDEVELMNGICRIIVEVGGYRLAWVGFAEHDTEKSVRPVAWCCVEEGFLETGKGSTGTAIRTGTTSVARHLLTNPDYEPWREEAIRHGYASSISLPLSDGERSFGALAIMADEPDAFDTEEVQLLEKLAGDLSYGIATLRVKAEQKNAEKERRLLAAVVDQASEGVLTFNVNGRIQYINPAFERICEYSREQIIGQNINTFRHREGDDELFRAMSEALSGNDVRGGHFINKKVEGTPYEVEAKITPVWDNSGMVISYAIELQDVTHEVQLEGQLRLAQKMEAIATLSGGIAHDFNNVLAAIVSNAEMAMDDIQEGSLAREHLDIVLRAGNRGRNLTRQILALSRRGEQQQKSVRIDLIVGECLNLLRASLPSTIQIRQDIKSESVAIMADPSQIHQVIMNLCTNAAHAMGDKEGTLDVGLFGVDLDADAASVHVDLHKGPYLQLSVSDSGHGMDKMVMERLFDPFFTTKEQGKGTGLGLSEAYGIVKDHGGAIIVESTPGEGSTFLVFLPRIQYVEDSMAIEVAEPVTRGSERILLVDDEEDLIFAGRKMLERVGYDVVVTTDGREALDLFRRQPSRFDLILTDLTMPHLTGADLAREVLRIRPDIPIILCTGFSSGSGGSISHQEAMAMGIRELVTKPFDRTEMTGILRRVLDEPRQTVRET